MGIFSRALDNYKKAELYELNKLWNLKKIALCYHNLKQPANALEYYREAEKIDPENLNIQLSIGNCLLELEQFEEALKCYFKVEYLSPGNKKVWRPIGWCSFVIGKKEQAEKYFQKLIDDSPNKHDLMNMGHVKWSRGNRKEALGFYKKSIEKKDFTEQEFFDVFEEDLHHLLDQGVDTEDVPIMLDQLRYFIEG
jgi:tetratricopeptide (TPR) repeat protein